VKFTGRGGRITVVAAIDDADAVVRVIDTGIGLSPETLATAFEMFTQADSSIERTRGGLDIGLGLARQPVEMHGGSLTAASAGPGHGLEVVVAHDGRQALREAAARPPDAVVLDIGLPGLNGYDVCRELRRRRGARPR
jgi:signal transduction histidine kinase